MRREWGASAPPDDVSFGCQRTGLVRRIIPLAMSAFVGVLPRCGLWEFLSMRYGHIGQLTMAHRRTSALFSAQSRQSNTVPNGEASGMATCFMNPRRHTRVVCGKSG